MERVKRLSAFNTCETQAERELILRALQLYDNKEQAAKAIGLSLQTFYRRLKKYGLL